MFLAVPTILIFAQQGKEKVGRTREHVTSRARLDTIARAAVHDWTESPVRKGMGAGFPALPAKITTRRGK
jgi:hypothetical protein